MTYREELVRQAKEMVPALLALAPQVENQRSIPQETVKKLIDTGLLRAINPTRFGGMGLDVDVAMEGRVSDDKNVEWAPNNLR